MIQERRNCPRLWQVVLSRDILKGNLLRMIERSRDEVMNNVRGGWRDAWGVCNG
jgi:hypothetical protein